ARDARDEVVGDHVAGRQLAGMSGVMVGGADPAELHGGRGDVGEAVADDRVLLASRAEVEADAAQVEKIVVCEGHVPRIPQPHVAGRAGRCAGRVRSGSTYEWPR